MTPLKASAAPADDRALQGALKTLLFLRRKMQVAAEDAANHAHVHEDYRSSAVNLLSYLALRRHDIRLLQTQLSELGLSSLGRCERSVSHSVDRVIDVLQQLTGDTDDSHALAQRDNAPNRTTSLQSHGEALFGKSPSDRAVRIMVTMPTEAADNYEMVVAMLAAGMNCQRINCAHDGPEVWMRMIEHLRNATQKLGKTCQVVMDLAGPKLRTGPLAARSPVLKMRPLRDEQGKVRAPARAYLSADAIDENCLQLPYKWLMGLEVGDVLCLRDARDSKRQMLVTDRDDSGCWVEIHKTAYILPGTVLTLKNAKGRKPHSRVIAVPSKPCSIKLQEGDHLVLVRGDQEGQPAILDEHARVISPACISCPSNAVFNAVAGDPIWFDDGKIGGVVRSSSKDEMQISIHHAPDGVKLKADKGINLPATDLKLGALCDDDLNALEFAAQHADIVEMSFVNSAEDVRSLMTELRRLDAMHLGVVLKIETQRGFENLPELLIAGMATSRLGVMIARGDLAVETGFERTAELQEEMLCLCEAAHVPVIWATQVLETLAKTGAPTRAEITDAAMGVRAECVMLNKGRHILKAIKTLDDLLKRMQHHHDKKRDMMRKLQVASQPRLSR
jgi:pyruvate kinase